MTNCVLDDLQLLARRLLNGSIVSSLEPFRPAIYDASLSIESWSRAKTVNCHVCPLSAEKIYYNTELSRPGPLKPPRIQMSSRSSSRERSRSPPLPQHLHHSFAPKSSGQMLIILNLRGHSRKRRRERDRRRSSRDDSRDGRRGRKERDRREEDGREKDGREKKNGRERERMERRREKMEEKEEEEEQRMEDDERIVNE
eukprot:1391244-Amorphochlora_amoeboformis.AAC.1